MTAAEILSASRRAGIELTRHGRNLLFRAPAGCLTEELRRLIVSHRPGVLELLPDAARRFSAEEEILFRFARMRRQAGAEIPPRELLARPGLSRAPGRCYSCGDELPGSGAEAGPCPPCEDATAIVRQLHREGRLWPAESTEAAA